MSYLQIEQGIPDFSQAVISLWFRVPAKTITEVKAAEQTPILNKIIPLMTFGKPQVIKRAEPVSVNVGNPVNFGSSVYYPPIQQITSWNVVGEDPVDPCYIGIDCTGPDPVLAFNIQMDGNASVNNFDIHVNRVDLYANDNLNHPGSFPPAGYDPSPGTGWDEYGFMVGLAYAITDKPYTSNWQPEFFWVRTIKKIEADHWHHLLLSFDLRSAVTTHGAPQPGGGSTASNARTADGVSSACKLWYAIDDVNYLGTALLPDDVEPDQSSFGNMGNFFVEGGTDPNAILTQNGWFVARPDFSETGTYFNLFMRPATNDYETGEIPSLDAPLGIPAAAPYVEYVRLVEMAELQIFTGVSADTSNLSVRRAFVAADGKPVRPAEAEKFLGKKPDVMLHSSSNWRAGKNTGTVGIGIDGKVLPAGQFKRTGGIEAYKPEPRIGV